MKRNYTAVMLFSSAVSLGISGCAGQEVKSTEVLLLKAGFDIRTADTEKMLEHLKRLQQNKLVPRKEDGATGYYYADIVGCTCIYTGNESKYSKYKQLAAQNSLADERLMAADAQDDARYDWGAWGWPRW